MLRHLSKAFKGKRGYHTFELGDFCMLRQVKSNKKVFVGPLEQSGERGVRGGIIRHDSIIGKKPRSVIREDNGISNTQQEENSCIIQTFSFIYRSIWIYGTLPHIRRVK